MIKDQWMVSQNVRGISVVISEIRLKWKLLLVDFCLEKQHALPQNNNNKNDCNNAECTQYLA